MQQAQRRWQWRNSEISSSVRLHLQCSVIQTKDYFFLKSCFYKDNTQSSSTLSERYLVNNVFIAVGCDHGVEAFTCCVITGKKKSNLKCDHPAALSSSSLKRKPPSLWFLSWSSGAKPKWEIKSLKKKSHSRFKFVMLNTEWEHTDDSDLNGD